MHASVFHCLFLVLKTADGELLHIHQTSFLQIFIYGETDGNFFIQSFEVFVNIRTNYDGFFRILHDAFGT